MESVLAQDYPHVEHVVQDGGSSDGTISLLRRYEGKIRWYSEPDRGQADGLDKAIRRSNGDILIVVNADDVLLPHAASWAAGQMERHPDDAVIYGDVELIDEYGKTTGNYIGPEYDFPSVFCVERVIPAQAAFIRRSALVAVGLGTDPSLDTCPDYEMLVRLGLRFPMRHERGYVCQYRHYHRDLDGRQRRSVDRFVIAKASVMARAFGDLEAGSAINGMERRARAGLYLWATQEARGAKDIEEAWGWYSKAMTEFSTRDRWLLRAALIQASLTARFVVGTQFTRPLRRTIRALANYLAGKGLVIGRRIAPGAANGFLKLVRVAHAVFERLSESYKSMIVGEIQRQARAAKRRGSARRPSNEPNLSRALFVGLGLLSDSPGLRPPAHDSNGKSPGAIQVRESSQHVPDETYPR